MPLNELSALREWRHGKHVDDRPQLGRATDGRERSVAGVAEVVERGILMYADAADCVDRQRMRAMELADDNGERIAVGHGHAT